MKVLWVTGLIPSDFALALGRQVCNIQGWIPSLISAIRTYAPGIELTVACTAPNGEDRVVNGVRYLGFGAAVGGTKQEIALLSGRIKACVEKSDSDIVHLHGSEDVFPALPKETWCGRPVAMSLQGILTGYYAHAAGGLIPREVKPCLGIVRSLGFGHGIFDHAEAMRKRAINNEQLAFDNIKYIFGRTAWDRAWTHYLNPSARYYVVGELMRDGFYCGPRKKTDIRRHTIYCGAALGGPLKGGHWLLRAVATLKDRYPDVRLRIAAADGCRRPESFYARIRQPQYARYIWHLIESLGISGNVDLLPSLTEAQVVSELRSAEVFCLPSLAENSPNSLGEAMLMGVPCIATDVGGISDLMKSGEQGLLVPSGDPAVLAASIARLFEDQDLASRFASCGHVYALKRYDKQTVVGQLQDAYATMMRRSIGR